jgi:ankyrin repeat protein
VAGDTPLHYAAKQSSRCVSLLLRHGARVDAANKKGQTPLDLAVQHGHPLFVHKLLLHSPPQSRDKMLLHCIDLLLEATLTQVQDKIRHVVVALCVKSFNASEEVTSVKSEPINEESFMNDIMSQICKQFITHGRSVLLEDNAFMAENQIRKFRVLMHTLVNIGVILKTNRELLSSSSENIAAIRVNNNNAAQEESDTTTIDEITRSRKWSLYQEHIVTLDPLWRTVSRTLHATHAPPSNTNMRSNSDDPAEEVKSDLNAVQHAAVIIEAFSELSKLHDDIEKQ